MEFFCFFPLFLLIVVDVSEECALPFWWNQQYNIQPFYPQVGQPKTTYRYREIIHRSDPNNFIQIKEYSEHTWWEHTQISDKDVPNKALPEGVHHVPNLVFGKDANDLNFGIHRTFNLNPHSKTNNIIPRGDNNGIPHTFNLNPHSKTNNIIPRGDADGMPRFPADPNRISPEGGFNNMIPGMTPIDDSNGMMTSEDSNGIQTSPVTNGMVTMEGTNGIETSPETNGMVPEEDMKPTSPVVPDVDFDSDTERERNENENMEVEKIGEMVGNDLETSSANRASSELMEPNSRTRFFGSWFGKKENETAGPCKVSGTDIHSLRSMIENMFSSPREHIIHPESKEKVREDILNKFKNFGLQVWTQNFTTPPMQNANGTEEFNDGVNLIGVIPGSQRGRLDDEIVLVGAHYDTVPDSNGVDDNGSGLAVMLEVARAITEARCRLNHTLMFVAFDHEENGAMGSNYFVDHYLIPEELKRARARFQGAFILDGILNYNDVPNTQELPMDFAESLPGFQYFINNTGNRGNFLAMISRNEMDNNLSQKLMNAWKELGENQYKLFNLQVDMGNTIPEPSIIEKHLNFLTSDHATFWYHNSSSHFPESLNAVLLTDTGPFRGQMKECYHSKCDDLTVISPEKLQFAKKTADALTATLVELTSATGAGNNLHFSWLMFLIQAMVIFYASKNILVV